MVDNSDLNEALRSITANTKPKKRTGEIIFLCVWYFVFSFVVGAAFAKWFL